MGTQAGKIVRHPFKSMSFNLCSMFMQMGQGKTDFSVNKNYIQKESHLLLHVYHPSRVSSESIQLNISFFCFFVFFGVSWFLPQVPLGSI